MKEYVGLDVSLEETSVCVLDAGGSVGALLGSLLTTRCFALTRKQGSLRNGIYVVYATVLGVALVSLTYFFLASSTRPST